MKDQKIKVKAGWRRNCWNLQSKENYELVVNEGSNIDTALDFQAECNKMKQTPVKSSSSSTSFAFPLSSTARDDGMKLGALVRKISGEDTGMLGYITDVRDEQDGNIKVRKKDAEGSWRYQSKDNYELAVDDASSFSGDPSSNTNPISTTASKTVVACTDGAATNGNGSSAPGVDTNANAATEVPPLKEEKKKSILSRIMGMFKRKKTSKNGTIAPSLKHSQTNSEAPSTAPTVTMVHTIASATPTVPVPPPVPSSIESADQR